MKGLAIYLIFICAVGILFWYRLDWGFYQLGVSVPYLILAIIYLKRKVKYSDENRSWAILTLILACVVCVWDNVLRFTGFDMGIEGSNFWGFLGRRTAIVGLLYVPAIVFSSVIIDRNRRHIISSEGKSSNKEL